MFIVLAVAIVLISISMNFTRRHVEVIFVMRLMSFIIYNEMNQEEIWNENCLSQCKHTFMKNGVKLNPKKKSI